MKKHLLDNIDFIFCSFVPVGFEDYVAFFKKTFNNFTYLKFKFPHSKGGFTSSINDKELLTLPNMSNKFLYFLFLPINYFIFMTQVLVLLWRRPISNKRVFMGVNYMCTFYGLILKLFKRVDFVIYRVTDFFPLPKNGPYRTLNKIFYKIDSFCLKKADSVWFTTEGHIIGREKYGYFNRKNRDYEIIPLGINAKKFMSNKITKFNKYSLVYCGVISRYHMLDLLFEALEDLKKEFPEIKLNLIGSGPDEDYFRGLSVEKGLTKNVIFHGFVPEGRKFDTLMSNNLLGVALYKNEEDFMKYTEPAKVKYYLGFGVPAIISDVPKIAKELDKANVAIAVENDKESIVSVIRKFMLDSSLQKKYKDNIRSFVKTVDINIMLEERLERTLDKFYRGCL